MSTVQPHNNFAHRAGQRDANSHYARSAEATLHKSGLRHFEEWLKGQIQFGIDPERSSYFFDRYEFNFAIEDEAQILKSWFAQPVTAGELLAGIALLSDKRTQIKI